MQRKYTPISDLRETGFVEFPIKIYRPNENPKFPDGGIMTPYLEQLPIGEKVKMSGPKGKFFYYGDGHFIYQDKITG